MTPSGAPEPWSWWRLLLRYVVLNGITSPWPGYRPLPSSSATQRQVCAFGWDCWAGCGIRTARSSPQNCRAQRFLLLVWKSTHKDSCLKNEIRTKKKKTIPVNLSRIPGTDQCFDQRVETYKAKFQVSPCPFCDWHVCWVTWRVCCAWLSPSQPRVLGGFFVILFSGLLLGNLPQENLKVDFLTFAFYF